MTHITHKVQAPFVLRFRVIIWLSAAAFGAFGYWSANAPLDEIVRGPGKVIPTSKTQVIQSLEGGILSELLVEEGHEIEKGAIVARLSDTKFKGAHGEMQNQASGLKIKLLRLKTELDRKDSFSVPRDMRKNAPKVAKSEEQFFLARLQDYTTTLAALEKAVSLQDKEVGIMDNLSKKELVAPIELLKAQQKASKAQADLDNFKTDYELTRSEEYTQTLNELNALTQTLQIRKDQLTRTTLRAPTRSIVNKVLVSTIGGVIAPGEEILELIPLDDELKIEAKLSPKDIAFIRPNMPATIKLTAYDYSIHGDLSGTVQHISADTFEDENTRDAQPYYKVIINVDNESINQSETDIKIRPGMIAETELHVGEKTVLEYLLKPLFKTTEAFREP